MWTAALLLAMAATAWRAAGAGPAGGGVLPAVDVAQLNAALQDDAGGEVGAGAARGERASSAARWLQLLEEWAREQVQDRAGAGAGAVRPFRLDLRLDQNGSLPLLVLPLVLSPDGEERPGPAGPVEPVQAAESVVPVDTFQRFAPVDRSTPVQPPGDAPDAPADPPQMETMASSEQLVAQFRREMSLATSLPPAMLGLPRAPRPPPPRAPPAPALARPAPPPPAPRWDRAMRLRAELRVLRADYTEPYTMWWDAESGASRVEMHGGATAAILRQQPDGTHQRIEFRVDNMGPAPVRRCSFAPPALLPLSELGPPALPDATDFEFDGYAALAEGRAEVWRRRVEGAAGEGGAARGEALTFTHELLVLREPDLAPRPLRYSVTVDSSLLGPMCDGYEHRFTEVALGAGAVDAAALALDARSCDTRDQLVPELDESHAARLQPLREFTMRMRDTRYDAMIEEFKKEYSREYIDDKEEAVRKNVFIQTTRFVVSANRQGASFELGANFLSDRLAAELDTLLGVVDGPDGSAERFPYAATDLARLTGDLPRAFDWRDEGGVSPVRYQGSCSSCWAVAVAGAVEGALFARTRRLVPLAEQALVDCAAPFGGNGCNGTWPSHAYDYVRARGLPPLGAYGPHKEKVEQCRDARTPPATHISAHVNVTGGSAPALRVAIRNHAPAVVVIDAKAKSFIFYKRGILYDDRCGKASPNLNHAVLAVGFGEEEGQEYFTVKNSWSAAWGEAGYARLDAQSNACGLLARASYPRLDQPDVGDQRAARAQPT